MKFFKGAKIITESSVLDNYILGFDGKFQIILPQDEFEIKNSDTIDISGLYIAPGIIDIHIHGSNGTDTMDESEESLRHLSSAIVKNGVTSFLATTMTMDWEKVSASLKRIKRAMHNEMPGAQLIGAHVEGPFLNAEYKGAQNPKYMSQPNWDLLKPYKDIIKIVTLAPELNGSKELISKLKEHNIIASMGHSAASYEQAIEGINTGITHCTHMFNAMSGMNHRAPGVACAALASDVYCELIPDTIHVHYGLFEVIRKSKGSDKIILISDCMEAGGMGGGMYSLGGQSVTVKDGVARLENGSIAGSVLKLNEGLYNFYKNTKSQLYEVMKMGSLNPAKELNIDDRKGSIAVGKDADFIIMDEKFNIKATYVNGKCVFDNLI